MVMGRRYLRYESLDAFLTDAEYIAGVETKQLGRPLGVLAPPRRDNSAARIFNLTNTFSHT